MKTINQFFILRELKGISGMTRYLVKEKDGMQLFMLRMIDEKQGADMDKWFELYDHYQLQVTNYKHLPKLQQIDGFEGTKAYAVLECPVGNRLKTVGSLTKTQVEQLIDAIGHLHKKSIAHGTINAENVWISKSGNITLFGAQEAEAVGTGPVSHIQSDTVQLVGLLTEYAPVDASRLTGCKTIGELQERLFFSSAKPGLVEKEMPAERKAPEQVVEQKPVVEKQPVAEKKTSPKAESKPRESTRPQPVILEQSYRQDVWPDSGRDQTREARNEQKSSKMMKFMMVFCAMIFLIWVGTQIGNDDDGRSAAVYEEEAPETAMESVEEEATVMEEEVEEELVEQVEEETLAPDSYLGGYGGAWGYQNSMYAGGLLMNLAVNGDTHTVDMTLTSIQAPPANRIASIEETITFNEYGTAWFTFEDDGWGSSGDVFIELLDSEQVMVTITYTYQNPDAGWNLFNGTVTFTRDDYYMDGWSMEDDYYEEEESVIPDLLYEPIYELDEMLTYLYYGQLYSGPGTPIFSLNSTSGDVEANWGTADNSGYYSGGEYYTYEECQCSFFYDEYDLVSHIMGTGVGEASINGVKLDYIKQTLGEADDYYFSDFDGEWLLEYYVNGNTLTFHTQDGIAADYFMVRRSMN